MNKSRNIIIILCIIIFILIIALVGTITYIFMELNDGKMNNDNANNISNNETEIEDNVGNEVNGETESVTEENNNEIANQEYEENLVVDNGEQNTTGDMDKLMFNSAFTSYLGNITGEKLNALIQTIADSNIKYSEHQIALSSNNLQDLNGIVLTDIYTITLSYDENGYVNNINIDKKLD